MKLTTLRSRLFLTVLAAISPGLVIGAYRTVTVYQTARARAYETVAQAVRVAVRQNADLTTGTRIVVEQAAQLGGADAACSGLRDVLGRGELDVRIAAGVASAASAVRCIAGDRTGDGAQLSAGAREAIARARASGGFAFGPYDLAPHRNESRLTAAAPLGSSGYYVFALVPLDWFGRLAEDLRLPGDSALSILNRHAVVLARYPEPQRWVGKVAHNVPLLRLVTTAAREDTGEAAGLDGIQRLYAFAPLERGAAPDTYVAVGIPSAVVFGEARQALTVNLLVMSGALLLGVVVSLAVAERFVLRRSSALVAAARRVAAGDLSARVEEPRDGKDEMSALSRTFNEMAASLESAHDVEQQRYAQLLEQRSRLDLLSRELLRVQERERQHIARELHDQIGQNLTALKMNLQIEKRGGRESATIDESIRLAERVLAEVRELSLALRPPLLAEIGLRGALAHLLESEAGRAGLNVHSRIDIGDARFPTEVELVAFRIAQEAITNVVRHANARNVTLTLTSVDGSLELTVQDDGLGFDVQKTPRAVRSFGLLGMEERAVLAGGRLDIQSAPGAGAMVRLRIPAPSQQADR